MRKILIALLFLSVFSSVLAQEEVLTSRSIAPSADSFRLEALVQNLRRPLYLTHAGDERLFVMEQGGKIFVVNGTSQSLFLNLTDLVTAEANREVYTERGLLGLAFAPDYAETGTFYVNYTDRAGNTVLARYQVSTDPNVADSDSAEILLQVQQPFPNHNGGHMAFGADGYLYVALGDGGAANDPLGAGQNVQNLLGSMLRLDVSQAGAYQIPADNPFADGVNGAPETWSYGWRNPWRFSFDRATGDMYIADVGQNQYEEVNFELAGMGGLNYGWNAWEATHRFNNRLNVPDAVMPLAEYDHGKGCSVTGGYVYRGALIADLQAVYLYGDFCSGRVWYAYRDTANQWQSAEFLETGFQISSFGEDVNGELYIVDYRGTVYKIVPA